MPSRGGSPYRRIPGARAGRRCPRCGSPALGPARVGALALEECSRCGGFWVAAPAFNELLVDLRLQRDVLALAPRRAAGALVEEVVAYLACPRCGQLMERTNLGRTSGVIVDACRPHGVWFDRDELRRAVEFVAARAADARPAPGEASARGAAGRPPPLLGSPIGRPSLLGRLVDRIADLLGL